MTLIVLLVVTDDKIHSFVADTVAETVSPAGPTPASEFAKDPALVRQIVADDATRSLRAALSFAGGELGYSTIAGALGGKQDRVGVNIGAYAVQEIADQFYLDGFVTFGAGRNNLDIDNAVLHLQSDDMTRSAAAGISVGGVVKQPGYEFWPDLSFTYGKSWMGDLGLTGRARSLVDHGLSLDAGTVTRAKTMFRPEIRIPLDGASGADSQRMVTLAPRFVCEFIAASVFRETCGGGAEAGFVARSDDGLTRFPMNLLTDRLGAQQTSSINLTFEQRF